MELTVQELELLEDIKSSKRYPIARFELRCSAEPSLISTALNHVKILDPADSMETVNARSALLTGLAQKGAVHLCYHLPISARSDFAVYYQSQLFAQLENLVQEGTGRTGFLFDTAFLKRGVATITILGREAYKAAKEETPKQ